MRSFCRVVGFKAGGIDLQQCDTNAQLFERRWLGVHLHPFLKSALGGVSCQYHAPTAVPWRNSHRCAFNRLVGPRSRYGYLGENIVIHMSYKSSYGARVHILSH